MAPSIRYANQSAPFWDFIASLEEQGRAGNNHNCTRGESSSDENDNERGGDPWSQGWATFPWGPVPHRGRHGPPPPPPAEGASDPEEGSSQPRGGPPPPPFSDEKKHGKVPHHEGRPHSHGPHHEDHPHSHSHHGPHRGPSSRGGPCGGRGGRRGGGFGGGRGRAGGPPFNPYASAGAGVNPLNAFAEMLQSQFFPSTQETDTDTPTNNNTTTTSQDFHPEIDIFDTPSSYVVHVSLPGAKKQDIGVSWDAEKSELGIAGVVHRPGDEEFLKTLALDERKVGVFERKVRLGSRANPASVDVEGISARMEDGVLRVEVPKLDDGGFVEVRKVDIE